MRRVADGLRGDNGPADGHRSRRARVGAPGPRRDLSAARRLRRSGGAARAAPGADAPRRRGAPAPQPSLPSRQPTQADDLRRVSTAPTASSSISRTRCRRPTRTPPGCWSATPWSPSTGAPPNGWCGSTRATVGIEDLRRPSPHHNPHTSCCCRRSRTPAQVGRAAELLRELAGDDAAVPDADPRVAAAASTAPSRSPPPIQLGGGPHPRSRGSVGRARCAAHRGRDGRAFSPARPRSTPPARPVSNRSPRSFRTSRTRRALPRYVQRERGLGFDGIGCIHPRQIPVVHREMTPTEAEAERAVRVVRAAREAEAAGSRCGRGGLEDGRSTGGASRRSGRSSWRWRVEFLMPDWDAER